MMLRNRLFDHTYLKHFSMAIRLILITLTKTAKFIINSFFKEADSR